MTRWTPEQDEKLAKLWADELLSTTEIAAFLGFGDRRGAVIGRAARLLLGPKRLAPEERLRRRLAETAAAASRQAEDRRREDAAAGVPEPPPVEADPAVKRRRGLCIMPGCAATRMRPYDECRDCRAKRRVA